MLNNFQRETDSDSVAFFQGAGMSLPSGYVNWKELMREIADELGLESRPTRRHTSVKRRGPDLAHNVPRADVVLYKMHGDVTMPDEAIFRPFPQVRPSKAEKDAIWKRYRQEMIAKVGFAVFLAGNKLDRESGQLVEADGVEQEFEIAVSRGVYPIPVGATGHMARKLSERVLKGPQKYFGTFAPQVKAHLETLASEAAGEATWLDAIFGITKTIAPK